MNNNEKKLYYQNKYAKVTASQISDKAVRKLVKDIKEIKCLV